MALARRGDVDLVVEAMGGEDGPAKATAEAALAGGKHLVTANKAMLARHGQALAEAAEAAGVALRFEAAVAGGIPVVKALTEGLAGNAITRVMGVLNGTCNYILTRMEAEDAPYAQVLEEAQRARLRRGRPRVRRRRHRRGAEAGAARRGRLRHAGRLRRHRPSRASSGSASPTSSTRPSSATASSCSGVARLTPAGLEARMQPCLVPAALAARPARGRHQHGGDRGRLRRAHRDVRPGRRRGADRLGDRRRRHRHRPRAGRSRPSAGRRRASPRRRAAGDGAAAAYYLRFLRRRRARGAGAGRRARSATPGVSINRMRQVEHADRRGAGADRHPPHRAARRSTRALAEIARLDGLPRRRRWRSASRRSDAAAIRPAGRGRLAAIAGDLRPSRAARARHLRGGAARRRRDGARGAPRSLGRGLP